MGLVRQRVALGQAGSATLTVHADPASRARLAEAGFDVLAVDDRTPALFKAFRQRMPIVANRASYFWGPELDRLAAHIAQARTLLAEARPDNPVGRKFDFLCQEFNREANTLCSKSADIELTRIGIDLKGAVERMREQVQNVE